MREEDDEAGAADHEDTDQAHRAPKQKHRKAHRVPVRSARVVRKNAETADDAVAMATAVGR